MCSPYPCTRTTRRRASAAGQRRTCTRPMVPMPSLTTPMLGGAEASRRARLAGVAEEAVPGARLVPEDVGRVAPDDVPRDEVGARRGAVRTRDDRHAAGERRLAARRVPHDGV